MIEVGSSQNEEHAQLDKSLLRMDAMDVFRIYKSYRLLNDNFWRLTNMF